MPKDPPSAPATAPSELDVSEPPRDSVLAPWSGTSFAAPAVAGAIARAAVETSEGDAAVLLRRAVIDIVHDPALRRLPGLGTVVDAT